eukprot:CAMPEP_0170416172 /NCGR_PEP_ID=MMETSP0117_2-20130122/33013_1 /TAXON_ID=400756 /ORGANISM="Durinskia baltica, Strain CSIRO CS-38" /LENGTH=362 /DNA_ID=CAMNT_0010674217 /DNA_START=9 /DNA_END=1094 /DNA_ORIENTATION=+
MTDPNQHLISWGSVQSHILTGGGILEAHSKLGVDYNEDDLPHYFLKKKIIRQTLLKWLENNNRSFDIVGAWERPLFSGGWDESTAHDTESFNLQSPSIFIDMRIPKARPTREIKKKGSLTACSDYDLRILARQHCFSGYSNTVFTRHHFIDWNFHPSYPRSRPNKWWVQTKASTDGMTESFKEFSAFRDSNNVPVYMERWARRLPQKGQSTEYLVLRKVRTCPAILKAKGLPVQRDAIFILVGKHWCLAIDRSYAFMEEYNRRVAALKLALGGAFKPPVTTGGGPAHVDNLLMGDRAGSAHSIDYNLRRKAAEEYLSLEGSYGVLATDGTSSDRTGRSRFIIQRSTQPWLEEAPLPWDNVQV